MFFAGTIMGIAGIMRIFDGVWAFRYDGALPENLEGAILVRASRRTDGCG